MITITEAAEKKIAELVAQNEKPIKGLRIGASSESPLKVDYKLAFVSEDQIEDSDQIVSVAGFEVFMDPDSVDLLKDSDMVVVRTGAVNTSGGYLLVYWRDFPLQKLFQNYVFR